jgi:hypothetical protein
VNFDPNDLLKELERSTYVFLKELDQRARSLDLRKKDLLNKLFRVRLALKPEILRNAFGRSSISLAAVDGSFSVKQIGGLGVVSAAAVSLVYEVGLGGSLWFEKWPQESSLEYHCVTPLLAHDSKLLGPTALEENPEIPNQLGKSLMRFTEYCALHDSMSYAPVVFRDGLLSSDYHALANIILATRWYSNSGLIGYRTTIGRITAFDVYINLFRMPIFESGSSCFAPQTLIFRAEEQGGSLSIANLDAHNKKLLEALVREFPEQLSIQGDVLELSEEAVYSNPKIQALVRLFSSKISEKYDHPLIIEDGNTRRILEPRDIDLLSVFKLLELFSDAKKRQIQLLGIAKDSLSNNFQSGLVAKFTGSPPEKLPRPSDKIFLEICSAISEPEFFSSNWSTIEYDSFMHTDDFKVNDLHTLFTPSGLFTKFYFQFLISDSLKSDVMVCERLLTRDPEGSVGQARKQNTTGLAHVSKEESESDVVLQLLLAAAEPSKSIPEALGHSYPLFEADKAVKHMMDKVDIIVENYYALIFTDPVATSYLKLIKSFRQKRSEYEKTRRSSKWKHRL